jgi:hypothetical protein
MQDKLTPKDKRIEREQGDVNTTANRKKYWERNLSDDARLWFDEDQKYFLHQSLSTPVLNVLSRAAFTLKIWRAKNISICTATACIMRVLTTRLSLPPSKNSWTTA